MLEEVLNEEVNQPYEGILNMQDISINKIKLGRNSRLNIKSQDLAELMASIKEVGILQPIGVKKNGNHYEVCYGNRRFMAASRLGMTKIPAVVHVGGTDSDYDIKNLTENLQRRNLTLSETGRYVDILNKQNLSNKEIAVRLGLNENYIKSAITAFREVPEEFREDIEVRVSNKKTSPGKISFNSARAIVNAQKTYSITKADARKLYLAAKGKDDFIPENMGKYISAIKAGKKDFVKATKPLKQIAVRFLIDEDQFLALEDKYVDNGPFKSVAGLCIAILKGEKSVKLNITK